MVGQSVLYLECVRDVVTLSYDWVGCHEMKASECSEIV